MPCSITGFRSTRPWATATKTCRTTAVVYEIGITAIDRESEQRYSGKFLLLPHLQQDLVLKAIHDGKPEAAADIWKKMSVHRFWQMIMSDAIDAYYAHPWAWDEIGFGGPAYPRAYTRLERGEPEPWEVEETRYDWLAPATAVSHEVDPAQATTRKRDSIVIMEVGAHIEEATPGRF